MEVETINHLFGDCNIIIEPRHKISNNVVSATSKASDQTAHTRRLIRAFSCRLNILRVLRYGPNSTWSFLAEKEAAQASLSLHLSKCHIVGNHMSRLIFILLLGLEERQGPLLQD